MEIINSIIELFTLSKCTNNIDEDDKSFELNAQFNITKLPSKDELIECIIKISDRDRIVIYANINDEEDITIYKDNTDRIDDLLDNKNINKNINLKIKVLKEVQYNCLSIYSFEKFIEFLNNKTLTGLLFIFKRIIQDNDFICFECMEHIDPFYTSSFYFYSKDSECHINNDDLINRNEIIEKRKSICHYQNASTYKFTPEDFNLIERSTNKPLNKIFDKLLLFHSIIFLFDITSNEKEVFKYSLNGFKVFSDEIDFANLDASKSEIYYKVYKWVYRENNLSDRIGLTRNLITIHLINKNVFDLDERIINALDSNYKIYLRENIQRYIEVKNKVSDFLNDSSQKASSIADSFGSSFKTSIYSFVTFVTSVFIVRALVKGNFTEIITDNFIYISLGILLLSLIYFFFSLWELNKNKIRFEKNYNSLKKRYIDLLDEKNIQDIFNNDDDFNEDIAHIKSRKCSFTLLWIITIVIFSSILLVFLL